MVPREIIAQLVAAARTHGSSVGRKRAAGAKLTLFTLGDIEVLFELADGADSWELSTVFFEFLGIDFQLRADGEIYSLQQLALSVEGKVVDSPEELYSLEGTELEPFLVDYLRLRVEIANGLQL